MPVKVYPDDRSYDDSRPTCRAALGRQSLPDEANEPFDAAHAGGGARVRAVVTIYNSYRNNPVIRARYFMPHYIIGYSYLA